jgi:lipoprotein-releasing system ATP-binding protein
MNDLKTSSQPVLLEVHDLHKSFSMGSQTVEILKGVNLTVKRGELVALVGASGAGKSTFLHIMGTLDRPTKGTVRLEGQDVFQLSEKALAELRNRRMGFVFQFHHLLPEFSALENTYLPALIHKSPKEEAIAQAKALLKDVGLEHRLHHKPGELSGGGNLDTQTGETLFGLLRDLNRQKGTAFVIVTHNERLSNQADRLIFMQDGQITEQKS